MKVLENAGLCKRENSVIMISPKLMVKGNQLREAWLMRRYEEISDDGYIDYQNSIDVDVDNQYTLTENGDVVLKAR